MAINVFTFSGFLGQDAELRFTADQKPVVSFSVASTAGYGDKAKTTWIRCNAWGERYTKIAQYLLKGNKVTVSGEFTQREWQDNQGVTKYSCEVRVNDIDLPPRSKQSEQLTGHATPAPQQRATGQYTATPNGPGDFGGYDDMESDIPF